MCEFPQRKPPRDSQRSLADVGLSLCAVQHLRTAKATAQGCFMLIESKTPKRMEPSPATSEQRCRGNIAVSLITDGKIK